MRNKAWCFLDRIRTGSFHRVSSHFCAPRLSISDANQVQKLWYPRAAVGEFRRQPRRLGRHEEVEMIIELPPMGS